MNFVLDDKLAQDTFPLGDLVLSRVLLMNDVRFDWLILAPRRPRLVELFDLDARGRALLMEEIAMVGEALRRQVGVEKINVGALGNIVRQLHVHVVARREGDAAWPGPAWGFGAAQRYEDGAAAAKLEELRAALRLG